MTLPSVRVAILGCAALAVSGLASAAAAPDFQIAISHPWIAAPPGGAPTAAGYLTLKNVGQGPDVLLGGESPVAAAVELHAMSMTGGIMRMRPVTEGLTLQPGQILVLKPGGGDHLMILHPTHTLKAGEQIPVTLRFRQAGSVRINFRVEPQGASPMAMP